MFDSHVHTRFSTDSKMDIEAAIHRASELGLGLITTEHMDLRYPVPGKFVFDVDHYFEEYTKYRTEKFLLGIELGLREDCYEENQRISTSHPFDYVLGSIHVVDGIDIYDESFYESSSKRDAYVRYFDCMYRCALQNDYIDSLAHIDYIARYARFKDTEIYYEEFAECVDEILKTVVDRDKALEINTRRLGDAHAAEQVLKIYKRFSELGGKFVTVGSDSHFKENIGDHFANAIEIADKCNLSIVHFKERNMIVSE